MATGPLPSRVAHRRAAVIAEVLDHALAVMTEEGVGALSLAEVARRTGMRSPSLYKYFPSRAAVYDALFARGLAEERAAVTAAVDGVPRGVAALRAGGAAVVRWAVEAPALAQLLHWRPVPGYEPSPEVFADSVADLAALRAALAVAARRGELGPEADSDEAVRLWTVLLAGLITQQLANEPGASYEDGVFSRLTDRALDSFLTTHRP